MAAGKAAYLRSITRSTLGKSVPVGKTLEGATPPSVFIGSWNYPRVYAGPLVAPIHEECGIMDTPESWIPSGWTQDQILSCRLELVRGKRAHDVSRVDDPFALKLQEVVLSSSSLESEVEFTCARQACHSRRSSPPSARVHLSRTSGPSAAVSNRTSNGVTMTLTSLHQRRLSISTARESPSPGSRRPSRSAHSVRKKEEARPDTVVDHCLRHGAR